MSSFHLKKHSDHFTKSHFPIFLHCKSLFRWKLAFSRQYAFNAEAFVVTPGMFVSQVWSSVERKVTKVEVV